MKVNIPYYHRDYSNDYSTNIKNSLIKRIFLASLPFIGLYKPAGIFLSVSLGALRSITSLTKFYDAYQKKESTLAGKYFLAGALASISVANCFFNHPTAVLLSSSSDIVENISRTIQQLSHGENLEGLCSFISVANSSIYLKILIAPSLQMILISYALQTIFELAQSKKEFQKGYIEGGSKLLMAAINGSRAAPYALAALEQHSSAISKQRENIARVFHNLAASLASPFWWYSEKGVRIFSPIRPDKPDQCSTRALEIAARVLYASLAVPMAPISIGLAAIEFIPRTLANVIQPHPFFYLKGDAPEKTEHTDSSFKVFTGNICAVAGGFSRLFGGVANWKHRINGIIDTILRNNPDVVCLQEVNDINAAKALYEALKGNYAHFSFNIGSKIFSQNSGHFIASKYSINEMLFLPFNSGKGLQAMVNKGLFSFALKCKNQVFAHIFAVHLSPSKKDLGPTQKETSARSREITKVMERIQKTNREDQNSPIIFLGDMNLKWGSKEWGNSPISKKFTDPYNQNRGDISLKDSTCCTDEIIHAFHQGRKRDWHSHPIIADHALLVKNPKLQANTTLIRFFNPDEDPYNALSDHNGLSMTVSLPNED